MLNLETDKVEFQKLRKLAQTISDKKNFLRKLVLLKLSQIVFWVATTICDKITAILAIHLKRLVKAVGGLNGKKLTKFFIICTWNKLCGFHMKIQNVTKICFVFGN